MHDHPPQGRPGTAFPLDDPVLTPGLRWGFEDMAVGLEGLRTWLDDLAEVYAENRQWLTS